MVLVLELRYNVCQSGSNGHIDCSTSCTTCNVVKAVNIHGLLERCGEWSVNVVWRECICSLLICICIVMVLVLALLYNVCQSVSNGHIDCSTCCTTFNVVKAVNIHGLLERCGEWSVHVVWRECICSLLICICIVMVLVPELLYNVFQSASNGHTDCK